MIIVIKSLGFLYYLNTSANLTKSNINISFIKSDYINKIAAIKRKILIITVEI